MNWTTQGNWLILNNVKTMAVRVKPCDNGKYMFQFRKTVSYADTLAQAIEYVEAGLEYFETMRRNPYN